MKFLGAAALAVAFIAAPAYATTTFAQYEQIDGGPKTVSFLAGTLTDTGGVLGSEVLFNFIDPMPPALDGEINAYLNIQASGAPYGGTISFRRKSDMANLLTVTFSGATLAGSGGSGALFGSHPGGGTVTYTSSFLDFTGMTAGDFSIGLSGIVPGFSSPAWLADSVGTFASDAANGGNGIPEPATWAMMIIGFGGMGVLLRRRRDAMALAT
jgi:hypothetical protein